MPTEGIRTLLNQGAWKSFEQKGNLILLLEDAGTSPYVKVKLDELGPVSYTHERLIEKWVESEDPHYRSLGLSLAADLLRRGVPSEHGPVKLVPILAKQLEQVALPDDEEKLEPILKALEGSENYNSYEKHSEVLSRVLIEKLSNPRWKKAAERLEDILARQANEPAVRFFLTKHAENAKNPKVKANEILGDSIPFFLSASTTRLAPETRKELADFYLLRVKAQEFRSGEAFAALAADDPRLEGWLREAAEGDGWIFQTAGYPFKELVKAKPALKELLRKKIEADLKAGGPFSQRLFGDKQEQRFDWLKTLFTPQERHAFYHQLDVSTPRERLWEMFQDLMTIGTAADRAFAEKLFPLLDKQSYVYRYAFHSAFPPALREQVIDRVLQGKSDPDDLIDYHTDKILSDLRLKDPAFHAEYLSRAKEIIAVGETALASEELAGRTFDAERKRRNWMNVLGSLDEFGVMDHEAYLRLLAKLPPPVVGREDTPLLPPLAFPADTAFLTQYLTERFPNRAAMMDHMTQVERTRDALNSDGRKIFDAHVAAIAKQEDAQVANGGYCRALCELRNNPAWMGEKLSANEGSMASLHEGARAFAIYNVVALFDLKSRGLCAPHAETDGKLASFQQADIPSAYLFRWVRESRVRELDKLAVGGQLNAFAKEALERFPVLPAAWRANLQTHLRKIETNRERSVAKVSDPLQLTPDLIYGLTFGKLILKEQSALPAAEQEKFRLWKRVVETGFVDVTSGFTKWKDGFGGSHFSNYAVGIAGNASLGETGETSSLIEDMKKSAAAAKNTCRIAYNRNDVSGNESAVYRSTLFYYTLWKSTHDVQYRTALVNCLKELVDEPLGRFHGADSRKDHGDSHHHVGKRGFAPYYYYGNMFKAAEAVNELLTETPDSVELRETADALGRQLLSQFNPQKKLFIFENTPVYTDRVLFQNPLMGLALVPFCARELAEKKSAQSGDVDTDSGNP